MFGFSFNSKNDSKDDGRIRVKTIVHKEIVVESELVRLSKRDQRTTLCLKQGWRYLTLGEEELKELRALLNAQVKAEEENKD